MELKFKVQAKIQKPAAEVFDTVYDPSKLSAYFTTGGASGPLDKGATVIWQFADYPGEVPVTVREMEPNRRIAFVWGEGEGATDEEGNKHVVVDESNMLHVEMTFEALDDGSTLVSISEGSWPETQRGLDRSYGNCHGWTQMICCLKAFVEYDVNLRKGFY